MKVADYIINYLAKQGIKECFVIYGAANGDLIDAFTRNKDIRYICTQHEQGAGFAAEGYAKITNKFGVAIATSGPGGMNFVTPIGNCFYDSVPCLFITGQVKTEFMRKDPSIRQVGFQETDIVSIVKPITKYAVCVKDARMIRYELEKALTLMLDGRCGPVLLDLPIDIQKSEIDPTELMGYLAHDQVPLKVVWPSLPFLKGFCQELMNSTRPAFLVGGGAREAMKYIRPIAEQYNIPIYPTWNAIDMIEAESEVYGGRIGTYGGPGRNFGIQNCDLLIGVGTRISGRITGGNPSSFARGARKWLINVDQSDLQPATQQVKIDMNMHFYAENFFEAVASFLKSHRNKDIPELKYDPVINDERLLWLKQVIRWRDQYQPWRLHQDKKNEDTVNPYIFMDRLSFRAREDDIIVSDCGGNQVIFAHTFETKKGQRCITNNGNSPMGFSMCGAIGAWFAQPNKGNIICIIGDGGMQMNIQELQTIRNYEIPLKIFILNNHIYGITKAFQKVNFEGRAEACEAPHYTVPNFLDVAEAYHIESAFMEKDSLIDATMNYVFKHEGPIICDVNCFDWHEYYPKISGWKCPIEDTEPYLPRDEFRKNMIIAPMPGWENHQYK